MRREGVLLGWLITCLSYGQVHIDQEIHFTGGDGMRGIEGLAVPVHETSAIPVSVVASGVVHWAEATLEGGSIHLTLEPVVEELRTGLLIRFLSPITNAGGLSIIAVGNEAIPLVRPDGSVLPAHALRANAVAEILFANGQWTLLNPATRTCPPGSVATVVPTCMDTASVPGLRFYEAIEHCADRGGKLCTWDEYAVGCAMRQNELSGLFTEWEWIDDTSNHTHTANQVGRFSCQSQRSANVIVTMTGNTRCCYRTR